ncbi:MAG: hypothetical protein AAGB23_05305 [Pseudomonadota bacterium]
MAKRKRKRAQIQPGELVIRPTPERAAKSSFRSAGMAQITVPAIDLLKAREDLSQEEYDALAYYRDQALLADKSPVRSCIDFSPKGGHGPGVAILSAQQETGRIERNFGSLWPLCRAVVVDDVSLEDWCLSNGQEVEDWETEEWSDEKRGELEQIRNIGMRMASPHAMSIALLELKYASGSIVRG